MVVGDSRGTTRGSKDKYQVKYCAVQTLLNVTNIIVSMSIITGRRAGRCLAREEEDDFRDGTDSFGVRKIDVAQRCMN